MAANTTLSSILMICIAVLKTLLLPYGVTLAQTAGHAVLRLADADVLPFDFRNLYQTINGYVKELMEFTDDLRQNTKADNDIVAKHLYSIAQDTADHLAAPVTKDEVPL